MIRRTLPNVNVFVCDICDGVWNGSIISTSEERKLDGFIRTGLAHDVCDQCMEAYPVVESWGIVEESADVCSVDECYRDAEYLLTVFDELILTCRKHMKGVLDEHISEIAGRRKKDDV